MLTIKSDKVVFIDCDQTLVDWSASEIKEVLTPVTINNQGYESMVYVNQKNVNLAIKLRKMGYTLIVWSQSGHDWAEAVAKAVGLQEHVTACMSKPRYYVDDLPCEKWMGQRIWRDPLTGEDDANRN
jgi:hypothetical protein